LVDLINVFKALRREPGESVRERLRNLSRQVDTLKGINVAERRKLQSLVLQSFALYHFELEHYDQALEYFERALKVNPETTDPLYYKAGCLAYLSRRQVPELRDESLHKALDAIEQAVNLSPKDAQNYVGLGWVLDEMGRFEEAIHAYDRAYALDPSLAEAVYNKACALAKAGQLQEALTILESLANKQRWIEDAREDDDLTQTLGQDPDLGNKFWALVGAPSKAQDTATF